jgi:hypothetical protein
MSTTTSILHRARTGQAPCDAGPRPVLQRTSEKGRPTRGICVTGPQMSGRPGPVTPRGRRPQEADNVRPRGACAYAWLSAPPSFSPRRGCKHGRSGVASRALDWRYLWRLTTAGSRNAVAAEACLYLQDEAPLNMTSSGPRSLRCAARCTIRLPVACRGVRDTHATFGLCNCCSRSTRLPLSESAGRRSRVRVVPPRELRNHWDTSTLFAARHSRTAGRRPPKATIAALPCACPEAIATQRAT